MSEDVLSYQYCTEVPFRGGEYCFRELTIANFDLLMVTISILITCAIVLAWAIGNSHD